jgi:hypothetical protein
MRLTLPEPKPKRQLADYPGRPVLLRNTTNGEIVLVGRYYAVVLTDCNYNRGGGWDLARCADPFTGITWEVLEGPVTLENDDGSAR